MSRRLAAALRREAEAIRCRLASLVVVAGGEAERRLWLLDRADALDPTEVAP